MYIKLHLWLSWELLLACSYWNSTRSCRSREKETPSSPLNIFISKQYFLLKSWTWSICIVLDKSLMGFFFKLKTKNFSREVKIWCQTVGYIRGWAFSLTSNFTHTGRNDPFLCYLWIFFDEIWHAFWQDI